MRMSQVLGGACVLAAIATAATVANAQPRVRTTFKANVANTVYVTAAPGDTQRLFSVQRSGGIRVLTLPDYAALPTPFLTVANVDSSGERGMLSMAFHPGYSQNGWIFFYYSRREGTAISTVIARCRVSATDPNLADASTLEDVLVVPSSNAIHQGGWIGFGPDGLLYIPLGDNGQSSNAQSTTSLRGKILRIDVDGPDNIPGNADDDGFPADATKLYTIPPTNPFLADPMPDEVWATGVRNPFRCSFDRVTGDFWVGDVGAGSREEATKLTTSSGGATLGWPCAEGNNVTTPACSTQLLNYVPPMFDYRNGITTISIPGACYIVGGYVYRGNEFPCLRGTYVFADGCGGLHSLVPVGVGQVSEFVKQSTTGYQSLGEDASGELYVVGLGSGSISKLEPNGFFPGTPDCDSNGFSNGCEIRLGIASDSNANTIPDRCEGLCTDIDFNNNGIFPEDQDVIDFFNVLAGAPCDFPACDVIDFNANGVFPEDEDVVDFFNVLAGGVC